MGMQTVTWSETDALYAAKKGPTLADLMLARGAPAEVAEQATPAEVVEDVPAARPALTVVPAQRTATPAIVCTEGSCLHARPGTPCDCTSCFGADHGAKSTLAPAACAGSKTLVDVAETGGYRYSCCPGCRDCTRPRLVLVSATARDPFARIPQVDDDAW